MNATLENPTVRVGDTVRWKGPRNHGGRIISGRVMHVGKLFLKVRLSGSAETWVDHDAVIDLVPGGLKVTRK